MIHLPRYQRLFLGSKIRLVLGGFLLLIFSMLSLLIVTSQPAAAAQTVPYKVNFQGRLADSTGASMADGSYNMTFRLFSGSTGGSAVWTEVRQTTSRVTLTNGQFNVQLGDVTSLSPSLFTTQPLYLEVELPTPASATCSTAACAVYTEGAMTPRQPLASSPYAMNADTLDGYDASSFIIASQNNAFTGTNLFKNASNSSSAFGVQKADGTSLFSIDTSAGTVSLGTGSNPVQFGLTTVGSITDTNEAGTYEMVRYQTGASAGATTSISAFIGSATVDAAPNNKIKLALYSDNAGTPGTLLATATEGIITTGWNTLPISATLSPATNYWLAFIMNGTSGSAGNLSYNNGGTSCWRVQTYASGFPSSNPPCTAGTQAFSMYATFASSAPVLTANSTGMVGIGTISPTATLEVDGTALYRNPSDTTVAFQIQNAAAATLFIADTTNLRIQIGAASADATAVVLVLDTKNTSGDPTGVDGAMYYNSASQTFRCYQNGWRACIGGAVKTLTTAQTISNTASETSFTSGYAIPANSCLPGRVYRLMAEGTYNTAATAPNITSRVYAGTTSLMSATVASTVSMTNRLWTLKADVTCLTTGTSGTVEAIGYFDRNTSASGYSRNDMVNTAAVTLNTTVSQNFTIAFTFNTASASNSITLRQMTIEQLDP